MKKSRLTWTNVLKLLELDLKGGKTNREIAERLEADQTLVAPLTRAMYEAGEVERSERGTGGTYYYSLPSETRLALALERRSKAA